MGLSGKYDFKGIKKYGAKGLFLALSSTSFGGFLAKWGLGGALEIALEWLANWLANKGLLVLNIGAIVVEGEFDQKAFDREMDEALKKVEMAGGKLTPEQMRAIDNEVIEAFRKFAVFTRKP